MSEEFWTALTTAFGLVLVIEGLIYALFPGGMKRMMAAAMEMPPETLRRGGAIAVAAGVVIVWLIRG
ncbi:MAG: DUF2065 domain-containing protein [Alphaproteobacteria bacterium]|nr:DUF2065 domain-containing protein [Alphaproteobacteria bacterium]